MHLIECQSLSFLSLRLMKPEAPYHPVIRHTHPLLSVLSITHINPKYENEKQQRIIIPVTYTSPAPLVTATFGIGATGIGAAAVLFVVFPVTAGADEVVACVEVTSAVAGAGRMAAGGAVLLFGGACGGAEAQLPLLTVEPTS